MDATILSFPTPKKIYPSNTRPVTLKERFLEAYASGNRRTIRRVLDSATPGPSERASTEDLELLGYTTDAIEHEVWDSLRRGFSPINAWNGFCIVATSWGIKF